MNSGMSSCRVLFALCIGDEFMRFPEAGNNFKKIKTTILTTIKNSLLVYGNEVEQAWSYPTQQIITDAVW
jgi:hypothetical protein